MSETVKNKGWMVTFAGIGINLALGILYTWSIFKAEIAKPGGPFNWDPSTINDPYAVCCLLFAFAMIFAGKIQDKFGPRVTALIGGILVGAGFIWISQSYSYASWVLGFGVLAGVGIGFGYSSATPPALKWFPAAKTGLIAGLVVSGFGLASVYIAPLAKYLIGAQGLQTTMKIFGIAFLIMLSILSMFLVNPPEGYKPESQANNNSDDAPAAAAQTEDFTPSHMLKQSSFWILWLIYFFGAGAGLMVIGSVAGMAKQSMGELAFMVVATMAVGNAGGRIVAGILSDKIGRSNTLAIMLTFQAILMFSSIFLIGGESSSAAMLVIIATAIGFNYGTNLALFPSITKDLWGLKNFGTNYGIIFTAWGVGGFVLSRVSQMIKAATGSFNYSFLTAGILLLVGVGLTFVIKKKAEKA
ncbi:MAG: OFA family MFS transporter [bacterium]|nr:OFA family MFS transporter [bacterium]